MTLVVAVAYANSAIVKLVYEGYLLLHFLTKMREYSRFQCEPRGFPQLNHIVMHIYMFHKKKQIFVFLEMARPCRLERQTHSLEGCCSIQLSYGRSSK